jgi:hypothetical protein
VSPPIEYRTLVGAYVSPDGTPIQGSNILRFIPSDTVFDSDGNIVVPPQPVYASTDVNGEFEVDLICTDAPNTTPTGWSWTLSELFPGGKEYSFQVPVSSPPVAHIADLAPAIVTQPLYSYATSAALAALDARVVTVEAQTAVTFGAVGIHPMLLFGG